MLAFTSLVFSLPFLAPVALASCAHGISFIHPRSEIFEAPEFNYGIKRGQMRWHALKEDWEVCGLGQRVRPPFPSLSFALPSCLDQQRLTLLDLFTDSKAPS